MTVCMPPIEASAGVLREFVAPCFRALSVHFEVFGRVMLHVQQFRLHSSRMSKIGRPRTASEAASAVIAVRFTPELKEGLERLVARTRERLAEQGITASVTESDVLRGLVAKAVKELDALQAQPPTPAPQQSLPSALAAPSPAAPVDAPHAVNPIDAPTAAPPVKAPRAVKPKAPAGSPRALAIASADELPATWDAERRDAHRKLSEFFAAHPDAVAVTVAKALMGEKDTSVFYKFLRGEKTLSSEYCRSLDAVLASYSS